MPATAAPPRVSFARTKIQVPRPRADLVERPQLEARVRAALAAQPVTLLVAPAGWGKTSALTRQCDRLGDEHRVFWLSLDEDDDLPRFLACLTGALAPLDLPWHVSPAALPALAQGERGLRMVSDEIVNALSEAPVVRGLLVFDDLHRVDDVRIVELLGHLVERAPPNWGMVIASRHEPALPISRWRASGRLAEFRQADLRFRDEEVAALLRQESLDEAGAATLVARAEGWAAGLRLMLSPGAQGAGLQPMPMRQVFDYLADEVLGAMKPEMQRFLMRCSVLPELTPARCAQVSDMPESARLFDEVERQGLFVSALDHAHQTLRLHDLFRHFLETRLAREAPQELPALLLRAAEGEGDLLRALTWLVRARAWGKATALLVRHGREMLDEGHGDAVMRVIGQFPADELARHPALRLIQGVHHFSSFDFPAADHALALAAEGFAATGHLAEAGFARTLMLSSRLNLGQIGPSLDGLVQQADDAAAQGLGADIEAIAAHYAAWAACAHGETDAVGRHYARAIRCLEQDPRRKTIEMTYFQTMLAGLPGVDDWMQRWERLVDPAFGARASLMRVGLYHVRAVREIGRGRLAQAAQWLGAAADDIAWLGSPRSSLTENLMLLLIVEAARGDATACDAAMRRQLAAFAKVSPDYGRAHGLKMLVSLAGAEWLLGRDERLVRLAEAARAARNPAEWRTAAHEHAMVDAMAALARGDAAAAETLLQAQVQPHESAAYFSGARARLLLAQAQVLQGRIAEAATTLAPWLTEVAAGGPVGGAVLAGRRTLDSLVAVPWGDWLLAAQVQQLEQLAALVRGSAQAGAANAPGAAAGPASGGAASPGEPDLARQRPAGLSEREHEVLAMLAAGDSNKLIARRLDLSPHTVKRHVANILQKLGVDSRGQAAARFRTLGQR